MQIHKSKHPVCLRLPWIGESKSLLVFHNACFQLFLDYIKICLYRLPAYSIIYLFKCQCNADYIGRTTQLLERRITMHVLAYIRKDQQHNLHVCHYIWVCNHWAPYTKSWVCYVVPRGHVLSSVQVTCRLPFVGLRNNIH